MPIYIACDHAGFELKNILKSKLKNLDLIDLNPVFETGDDYPLVAKNLAIQIGESDFGIAICGTGEGICMALNRFKNIRAALVNDPEMAKIVRRHNHANILCLAGQNPIINIDLIIEVIYTFLNTAPDLDQRHLRRVKELGELN